MTSARSVRRRESRGTKRDSTASGRCADSRSWAGRGASFPRQTGRSAHEQLIDRQVASLAHWAIVSAWAIFSISTSSTFSPSARSLSTAAIRVARALDLAVGRGMRDPQRPVAAARRHAAYLGGTHGPSRPSASSRGISTGGKRRRTGHEFQQVGRAHEDPVGVADGRLAGLDAVLAAQLGQHSAQRARGVFPDGRLAVADVATARSRREPAFPAVSTRARRPDKCPSTTRRNRSGRRRIAMRVSPTRASGLEEMADRRRIRAPVG